MNLTSWRYGKIMRLESLTVRVLPPRCLWFAFRRARPFPSDIDRRRIKAGLDVGRVEFLDHFNTGAAVLGDLINVRTLHQAQADIGVT